jgi:sugar lactone lactonase YvrE
MVLIKRRTVLKLAGSIVAGLVALALIGWTAFVPSAKEPSYEFVETWGERGSGPGQFNDPTGIAVANDEVFVADARNGRIQVFGLDGHFKRQFGRPGEAPGELGRPMNLTVWNNELYVPEYFNDRIQVFGLDGTPKRVIGKPGNGPGEFSAPGGVAATANGDLLVADFYNHRVQLLKPNGAFIRQWGETGQTGHTAGRFDYPTDVAVGRNGSIYAADGYGNRIQVFSPLGTFLRKWGGPFARGIYGPFNGWFMTATSVAIDAEGNVFVADFYNDRIQKFSADGDFRTSFGGRGGGADQFEHAIAVAVAKDGTVFAADLGNNRILKWQPKR